MSGLPRPSSSSMAAMGALLAEKVYSKYLQYHLFFKLVNQDTNAGYDDIKKNMIEKINQFDPDSKVLYYKLKRTNDQLTGCGDFVVDSYETQTKLLTAKKLDLGEGVEATFTPYINIRRNQFRQRNNIVKYKASAKLRKGLVTPVLPSWQHAWWP